MGVIGHGEGLVLVVEGNHRGHRAEGLLAIDAHLRRHARQHRRRIEKSAVEPAIG